MKSLVDTMHDFGYKFGIHDQYRDYYHAAPSYDENYACRLPDRTIPGHSYWAGGPQSYLCATQAPFYVKRNFAELKKNGIRLDGAYLDVFTCNEGDECANPEHVMTRRDCYTYRGNCFSWLLSQGDSLKLRGGQRLGRSVSGILPLCAVRLYAAPGRDTEKRNPGAAL